MAVQLKPELMDLMKKSEAKRIAEKLTKVELTDLLGVHYNYYWNCVTRKNNPSPNMVDAIRNYLDTPTSKVYESIFARRGKNDMGSKRVSRDEEGREVFHEKLDMREGEFEEIIGQLKKRSKFREPVDHMTQG
jgi:transcriptional regulator with XRE-family HTH domain